MCDSANPTFLYVNWIYKSISYFPAKIHQLDIVISRIVNILTANELVKLMML